MLPSRVILFWLSGSSSAPLSLSIELSLRIGRKVFSIFLITLGFYRFKAKITWHVAQLHHMITSHDHNYWSLAHCSWRCGADDWSAVLIVVWRWCVWCHCGITVTLEWCYSNGVEQASLCDKPHYPQTLFLASAPAALCWPDEHPPPYPRIVPSQRMRQDYHTAPPGRFIRQLKSACCPLSTVPFLCSYSGGNSFDPPQLRAADLVRGDKW